MKYKVFLIIIILFFTGINSYSQTITQINEEFPLGSPYTSFGIGDIQYSSSIRTESMNILGISLYGDYVNNMNPAANTRLSFTNVTASFRYNFLKSSDNSKNISASNGNVQGLNIGIPFNQSNGWVLNLGFNPLSQINYKVITIGNLYGKDYTETYAGNGGMTRINLGMTYKIFSNISVGFEYNYAFGDLKRISYLDFNDANYQNSYIRKENNINGSFFKGGLIFDIGKILKAKAIDNLVIGVLYQSKLNLKSELDGIFGSSTGLDTIRSLNGDIEIPQAFGFGITNSFGRVIVSSDFLYQQWSDYKEGGNTLGIYQNTFRWGLGFAITPPVKKDLSFWDGIEYRFGGFIDNSYFKINNQQINGYGLGIGFGIPINHFNSIDLGFNFYTRGKTEQGFIKDNYFKITAGLNFGELWFLKRAED